MNLKEGKGLQRKFCELQLNDYDIFGKIIDTHDNIWKKCDILIRYVVRALNEI